MAVGAEGLQGRGGRKAAGAGVMEAKRTVGAGDAEGPLMPTPAHGDAKGRCESPLPKEALVVQLPPPPPIPPHTGPAFGAQGVACLPQLGGNKSSLPGRRAKPVCVRAAEGRRCRRCVPPGAGVG